MSPVAPLPSELLRRRCAPEVFDFETTADLPDLTAVIGQERPVSAIRFGIKMDRQGYNIFALGPTGVGKYSLVHRTIAERAAAEPPPPDWCYVNNFDQPYRPRALRLPAGRGRELRRDMQHWIEEMQSSLSAAFESEEYQARRRTVESDVQDQQQARLTELQEQAKQRNLALLRTPAGLAFAPVKEGSVIPPEEYEKLTEEQQKRIQADVEVMQEELQKVISQAPRWERDLRSRLRDLNREVADIVLDDLFAEVTVNYQDLPDVLAYLEAVKRDVSEHLGDFLSAGEKSRDASDGENPTAFVDGWTPLRRYQVNLLVDSADQTGAPVIYESNPTYLNLTGRVEQMAQMGALVTDFMLIKPGTLHRANSGYLLLDAMKVLTNLYSWEGLKRALQFGEIRIESALQMLSLTSTVSLEPEPIPLNLKVVLLGDRMLYYLLADLDPDFPELFKVAADFSDEVARSDENHLLYAQLIGTVARREGLRPLNRAAVAGVIEHAARMVGDSERLTAQIQGIVDLLQEANYWAEEGGAATIDAGHIQQAISSQIFRLDRVAQLMKEEVLRKTINVTTEGSVVGQINGLSVLQLGSYSFGQASRITATVKTGRGDVLSIDREVNMSGPIHNKGVLILASFLNARYGLDRPLALSASVVFEQSYGGVEGDSASSTQLYVLLSALAVVPLKQGLAVTGSVDQSGRIQAIGGVNEKIEGFFDLCNARGLTGDQGVLIPASNVKHLMLRQDVVDAVVARKFHIYPVEHVDEGIELLTGLPAGERDRRGRYPLGSFNRRVEDHLLAIARRRMAFEQREKGRAERAAKRTKGVADEKDSGAGEGRNGDEEQAQSIAGDTPKAQESRP